MASIKSSRQSRLIVHKRIWVMPGETRVVEILERYLKEYPAELTSMPYSCQWEGRTYRYVSGTRRCTEKLRRSIKDSVAQRKLAGTVAGTVADISKDLQGKHKIIKCYYVSPCLCSTSTEHWFVLPQIM